MTAPRHRDPRLARVIDYFEQLSPADLARLGEIYADEATFKDPFNEVQGVAAIGAVFAHMYRSLHAPRFVVHESVAEGEQAFLTWDFLFHLRRGDTALEQCIRGATHIVFAEDGRVARHRDYWDAAEELYEKLPLAGTLMRWLKRRVNG